MRIGILGTGIVGQTLGLRLVQLGHRIMLGTRDPSQLDEPKGRDPDARTLRTWLALTGSLASVGTFREAAVYGELVINALSGVVSLEVLQTVGEAYLSGKTLIDTSNPIDLGDISTARGPEMMLAIGHAVMRALSPSEIAFKVVR